MCVCVQNYCIIREFSRFNVRFVISSSEKEGEDNIECTCYEYCVTRARVVDVSRFIIIIIIIIL